MIVRFLPSGHSFKWLGEYLTHDADKARTAERVAWTHTINLAHEDVPSAIHSMFNTFRDRDLLKAEAGIRPGGAKLEKPVKHFSLNWHPDERPTREHMIETTKSFLKRMGWQDHQCVLVAHHDKKHRHVHVMLNAVHPERGTRLNDKFERRRAQEWALGYEREHVIYCEERLKPVAEREASPPRNVWQQLKQIQPDDELERAVAEGPELGRGPARHLWQADEWRRIREQQKEERLGFFADGKRVYRECRYGAYRQVRKTYRREWREFYILKRAGASAETLAAVRADLVARQTETVKEHCATACEVLRGERDITYRGLLDRQKAERAELIERQEKGLRSPHLSAARTASAQRGAAPEIDPAQPRDGTQLPHAAPGVTGFHWTHCGRLAAQQRSATRWFDRALERANRRAREPTPEPSNPLAAAAERRMRKEPAKMQKPGVAVAIEPDG